MSPYIEQAAERARLPIRVEYEPDSDFWWVVDMAFCIGPTCKSADRATRAYVQLRSKLEDGQ